SDRGTGSGPSPGIDPGRAAPDAGRCDRRSRLHPAPGPGSRPQLRRRDGPDGRPRPAPPAGLRPRGRRRRRADGRAHVGHPDRGGEGASMNLTLLLLGGLALALAAWLRAAASAVSQIPRADAHHDAAEGEAGARAVATLIDDRPRLVPAVGMVGTALLVVAAVALVIPAHDRWTLLGALAVLVGVVLLGDILPRMLGRSRPRSIAYRSAPLLAAAVWVGGSAAERIVEENGNGGEEDEGEHDEDELALISSVLRFSETIVREVMVPRLDMVTLPAEADADEMAALAIEHGYSRFPVMEGDEVIGVLLVKDLLP